MEIQQAFKNFLELKVNLNPERVKKIKEALRVLPEFISGTDSFKSIYRQALPQGSYRQKTIIKPKGEDLSFDLDLMIVLNKHADWQPNDYLINLAKEFKSTGRYKDLTDTFGKTRCVTIDYEGDFHVDLVPAIIDAGKYWICNKNTNKFELSDGDGYAEWFQSQDAIASGNLVFAVRLIKYLRDYKGEFDTKSIILTTITGMQVTAIDVTSGSYKSIPGTFGNLLIRMDQFLSQFTIPPSIANPAMPGETFNRHWKNDQSGFEKFKTAISDYSKYAQHAQASSNQAEELKIWAKLFGDEFVGEESTLGKGYNSAVAVPFTPQKPWGLGHD